MGRLWKSTSFTMSLACCANRRLGVDEAFTGGRLLSAA
jgi:hypothetical protein